MIEIDIASATVRMDGRRVDLPPRELALLLTLALPPRVWPSYQLIPLLWPQTPVTRNCSLKVYVHRLRRRLTRSLIHSTNKGYELAADTSVDLWDVQTLMRREQLTASQRQTISHFYVSALAADRSFLTRCSWFATAERLITGALAEAPIRLAQDALDRNQFEECLSIVRMALPLIPGDRRLREVAIGAYLRRTDEHSAMREYEDFLAQAGHKSLETPIAARILSQGPSRHALRRPPLVKQPAVLS